MKNLCPIDGTVAIGWEGMKAERPTMLCPECDEILFLEELVTEATAETRKAYFHIYPDSAPDEEAFDWDGPLAEEGALTVTITRNQLECWAGRKLTDDEVSHIDDALPNTSLPDLIATVASNL